MKDSMRRAFPGTTVDDVLHGGLTIREWYAGQAIAPLMLAGYSHNEYLAIACFAVADAMIAESKK